MTISALVVGFGSIGKRHLEILENFSIIDNLAVLSRQKNLPYKTLNKLEDSIDLNPDYIVIASNTSLPSLKQLLNLAIASLNSSPIKPKLNSSSS